MVVEATEIRLRNPADIAAVLDVMNDVPLDGRWAARVFDVGEETRNDLQNRLMWHWNHEIAGQHKGHSPEWIHGECKLLNLTKLYGSWGGRARYRGKYVDDVIASVVQYEHKVVVAFDMVRTRKLGVKRFAEYLTVKQQYWASEGFRLTTSDDLYFKAMGLK